MAEVAPTLTVLTYLGRSPLLDRRGEGRGRGARLNHYFLLAFPAFGGTFALTHFNIRSAISRLFESSIIMCVVPLKTGFDSSSSLTYSAFAAPCPVARRALIASTVV